MQVQCRTLCKDHLSALIVIRSETPRITSVDVRGAWLDSQVLMSVEDEYLNACLPNEHEALQECFLEYCILRVISDLFD